MNIATLGDLNTPADNPIQVLPLINGHTAKCVTLSQAELTLLAVELKIPLDKPARESAFESVELLNFPDARGSQTIPALMENAAYPLASLLSQAKMPIYSNVIPTNSKSTCYWCVPPPISVQR